MKKFFLSNLFCILCLISLNLAGQDLDKIIADIPNPRVANGTWVYQDFDLLGNKLPEINHAINELERETSAEMAVVILTTIGENDPKDCVHKLFNYWGIGKKDKDNGVLILHILDQRRVEIETGYGMESILPDVKCKWVIDSVTIPFFKQDNFAGGHFETVQALIRGIKNPDISKAELIGNIQVYQAEVSLSMEDSVSRYTEVFEANIDKYKSSEDLWWEKMFFLTITGFILLAGPLGIITFIRNLSIQDPKKRYDFLNKSLPRSINWITVIIFIALGIYLFSSIGFGAVVVQGIVGFFGSFFFPEAVRNGMNLSGKCLKLRKTPRTCKKCKSKMELLSEKEEDVHLDKVQLVEEKIKSKDYDVWECTCGEIRIDDYEGRTHATKCPECKNPTYYVTKYEKIKSATYSSSGLERYHYSCGFCKIKKQVDKTIPKLEPPSSSSNSGSSSSSSSFGGGSSGGGGAGGSY